LVYVLCFVIHSSLESSAFGARTWTAHDFRPGRKNYRGATGAAVTGSKGEKDSTFGEV